MKREYLHRFFSFALALSFVFGGMTQELSAQSSGGGASLTGAMRSLVPLPSGSLRPTGSSFGSEGSTLGPTETLKEPVFGGLTYQVHILGEVTKPGTYRVIASTRLSEALQQAGGLLSRGSQRGIEIRRKEGGTRKVDLLAFRQAGDLDSNPYLLDNDVVYVPLTQEVVQVAGTVRRPAIYELKNEKTVEDIIKLAGGFTIGVSDSAPIRVIRYNHGVKEVMNVENSAAARKEVLLKNGDVIVVPHLLTENKKFDYNLTNLPGDNPPFYPSYEERIFVLGAVFAPGPYSFSPYYTVRQYLTVAGGTTKLAKKRKMRLITTDGKSHRANLGTEVNPGDTIVVPERYMSPENFTSLILGITTSALGITTAVLTLTR